MLASDVVRIALTKIGVVPVGEAVPSAFSVAALEEMNAVLQEWGVEGLKIHVMTTLAPLSLTPGTATYTIGASGTINVRRPVELVAGVLTVSTDQYRELVVFNDLSRYRSYTSRPSGIPSEAYYDPAYPLGVFTFYPTPDAAYSVSLTTLTSQAPYAIGDTILLPPEYESALPLILAVRLMHAPFGKMDAMLVDEARQAKAALTTNNSKRMLREARFDVALTSSSRGSVPIHTG
jgi:hypothetical protein